MDFPSINQLDDTYSLPRESGGLHQCPICKSTNVHSYDGIQSEGGYYAWTDRICEDCKATWTEIFTLTLVKHIRPAR